MSTPEERLTQAGKGVARLIAEEYVREIGDLRAACLESWFGLIQLVKEFNAKDEAVLAEIAARRGRQVEQGEFDDRQVIFAPSNPWAPNARIYLTSRKSDFRERNRKRGANQTLIANSCLATVYQLWEDHYRGRMAAALGIPKNALRADAFGELRTLRRSIIHNKGRAIPEVRKCVLFPWFQPGDLISIGIDQLDTLVSALAKAAVDLAEETS